MIEGETNVMVMMCEGEVLGVQTKEEKITLTVTQAEPAVKGNTSQTARKKVTLETGFELDRTCDHNYRGDRTEAHTIS